MLKAHKMLMYVLLVSVLSLIAYGLKGYWDALADAPVLIARAQILIEKNLGGAGLGDTNLKVLLKVEDPNFYTHYGVDFSTPGAGATTILNEEIAISSHEQTQGITQVTSALVGLDSTSQANTQASEQMSHIAKDLNQKTDKANQLIRDLINFVDGNMAA